VKVLLVADAVGGVFTYAVELARALAACGVEIVLATEGARVPADRRAALRRIEGLVHDEGAFALEWMEEPWEDVAAAGAWLLALEARERPDVVHLNAFAHGALPFRAPKLVVGHSCVLSWFEAVRGEVAPPSWDRYRAAVAAGLRGADAIAAPSAWMAAALVRHHGPIRTPIVLPNGRDPARFTPAPKEERILGAGRLWDEAKNAAALDRIAPALPWPVFIAGETAGPTSTSRRGEGTGAAHPGRAAGAPPAPRGRRAAFLGHLPEADLARWLATSAIFAHPARYEPFGLAVLEAALSGCALVLGDIPSLRETWQGAAEFAPPADDAAIAARIRALAGDPGRRRALGVAARARALRHGPERMAEAHLAAYRALLARPALAGAHP
jgi:glycogen synthase